MKDFITLLTIFLLLISCNKNRSSQPLPGNSCFVNGIDTCNRPGKITITVDLNTTYQSIQSFGASDCWTTKFIGKWTNVQKKNQIADLLFSIDTATDGSPKGIGLSLWRFNIGAGSFEQGDTSNIASDWRREECFQSSNDTYDWSKQKGQQWFLQAAKVRGVPFTLGFSLSPPVFMTKNLRAYNSTGSTKMNIQDGKMDAYADFMAEVTNHFQFDFLSPVNEPQWTWGQANSAGQEGTQAENTEVTALTKLLSQKLASMNSSAKVVIGEAGLWNYLYGSNTDGRGDQIFQFFSPSSLNYVGNLTNVARTISGHSYFTTCPDNNIISIRKQVYNKVMQVEPSLELWQSEFGILGDICGLYNGSPRNTGIDYGLYVAKVLHHDLVITNVTSWQWWLAVSPYNYSDALVYINAPNGFINVDGCKQDGIVLDSKQLWCFGNFARFIRPGMKRINVSVQDITDPLIAASTLMISAYKDAGSKKIVIVIINPKTSERVFNLTGKGGGLMFTENVLNAYTTDNLSNLKKSVMNLDNIKIPAQSVVTLTGTYQ